MTGAIRAGDIPGVQLRCRRAVSGARALELWHWLIDRDRLRLWLADEVEVEDASPETLVLSFDSDVGQIVESIRTLTLDAPHRWIFDLVRLDAGWPTFTDH